MSDIDWDLWAWQVSSSGTITIKSPDGSTIAESIAIGRDGINAVDNDGRPTGEWTNIKINNRAVTRTVNFAFSPKTSKGKALREKWSPSDDTFPLYATVGWSRTGEGLVFAKAPRKGLFGQVNGSESLRDQNSFRGNEFWVLKKRKITAAAIIPHISLTIPTNLTELKQALWTPGTPVSDTRIGTGHWTRQEELSDLIKQQADILFDGTPLNPITRCSVFRESTEMTAHATLSQPTSPLGDDWIPNSEILLQGEYDTKLLRLLNDFARRQCFDHLNVPIMLQACEVYHDILSSPDLQQEEVFKVNGKTSVKKYRVPECPLNFFVVYFPHWIRFAEFYSMSDYIHPFRFVTEMYSEDAKAKMPYAFDIFDVKDELDYDIVRRLLISASSKVSSVDKDHKVRVLPFMMEGTRIPMVNFGEGHPIQAPHRIALALTGIGNVYSLGAPSYAKNISTKIELTIPMDIAKIISPHRQHAGVSGSVGGRDSISDHKATCLGPIWKVECPMAFDNHPLLPTHPFEDIVRCSTSIFTDDSKSSRAVVETLVDEQSIDEENDASMCSAYPALDNEEYRKVIELLGRPRQHCAWNQVADQLLTAYSIESQPPVRRVLAALDEGLERVREDRTQVKSLLDLATWGEDNPFVKWLPQTVCRFHGHDTKDNDEQIYKTLKQINEDIYKLTCRIIISQYTCFTGDYDLSLELDRDGVMEDVKDLLGYLLPDFPVEAYIENLREVV
ncbi:hypothetical protein TARUN_5620 [Trichoderma arundinaceum]|uniref:Uncharacterized protein n=1 Tax=Trichoderma arundinaceum TaxID=490622 RepID=A0A395NKU6_TRIAR|nr:hypothetical protein TARUN_5620 [Trichoderma arundinaceum]